MFLLYKTDENTGISEVCRIIGFVDTAKRFLVAYKKESISCRVEEWEVGQNEPNKTYYEVEDFE